MHELDNMDASASGNPWYPLECIIVSSSDGVVVAVFTQVIGRCSKSVLVLFAAVLPCMSGVVGCLHMSVGLKIESLLVERWFYACVIAYE